MKPISRRTILKGAGAALSLPILDAMLPKAAWAAPEMLVRNRVAFIYCPNGAIMEHWIPTETGTSFTLPKTLAPLEAYRDNLIVTSGLAHNNARALGDGPGDHARDSAVYLTATHPKKSDSDIKAGVSVDQYIASRIGDQTRLPSLELGLEASRMAGNCDSGYGCIYSSNIAWSSETTPVAKETKPQAVFERMFGDGSDPKASARRNHFRQSILDFVADDAKRINQSLGMNDRRKVDEYFTSVREVEKRIEQSTLAPEEIPPYPFQPGAPKDFAEHVRQMYDLMALAYQTDTTRVITLMLANSGSGRAYQELGVSEGHHQISHHQNDPHKVGALQKIDQHMVEQFAYFLGKLQDTKEGDGNLLKHSMLMYGCALADPDEHAHHNLPIVLAGGGNGKLVGGRHLQYKKDTPLANAFVTMINNMGIPTTEFGDSNGELKDLASA
ncbi:DUF1552 domain-containing protein [Planctomicrobium sp. SH668]|uniref:DUF1552 domain-containing protein n=1 Tax=Planctomicrobium sp. SH668 TaxID=3448126 RepID=UPI003F5C2393